MVKEMLVGMAFAFAIAALFAALSTAGALLDTMIGFCSAALVDPVTGTQSSVLTQLYTMVGVADLHRDRRRRLGDRRARPHLRGGAAARGARTSARSRPARSSRSRTSSARRSWSARPVLLALVITDAAFGIVSRVVPQLNVFAVGFPAKIAVGFLLIGASLPFVAGWLADELQRSVATALQTLKVA